MSYYSCQDFPDVLRLETHVVDTRPDAVTLRHTSFYPGGGAQLADRGTLLWTGGEVAVTGLTPREAAADEADRSHRAISLSRHLP
jgi:misacylated tRNA(Ala) deacylase